MARPKHILITGASSGLGAALAVHYAGSGVVLHISGRNEQRLRETARLCEEKGATVHGMVMDVTDSAGMQRWIESADALHPIDLVIANAAITTATGGGGGESAPQVRKLFATNIDGVVNTISPLIPRMIARGRGQVALIGSLAGLCGLSTAPAYSASKGWVRLYGEGLRNWLGNHGIKVSVVCPGYIKTPMTDGNDYPMPHILTPDQAAARIAAGLAKNKSRIVFPRSTYLKILAVCALPMRISDWILSRRPHQPPVSRL